MKPFVKWAGGKSQIVDILFKEINKDCETYIEPFLGGGALFFHIITNLEKTKFNNFILNDLNSKLILVYETIKKNKDNLIKDCLKIQETYNSLSFEEQEKFYYKIREKFNSDNNTKLENSVYFIFLNKCGFNGLYRENKEGMFNVPFGKKNKVKLIEEENIINISNLFNSDKIKIKFLNKDYKKLIDLIGENTFVYFDPPYRPISKSGFNNYIKTPFNDDEQLALSNFCKKINKKNSYFILSNSDSKLLDPNDTFFDNIFSDFKIKRIEAKRTINSNGKKRGKITEILVKNF